MRASKRAATFGWRYRVRQHRITAKRWERRHRADEPTGTLITSGPWKGWRELGYTSDEGFHLEPWQEHYLTQLDLATRRPLSYSMALPRTTGWALPPEVLAQAAELFSED